MCELKSTPTLGHRTELTVRVMGNQLAISTQEPGWAALGASRESVEGAAVDNHKPRFAIFLANKKTMTLTFLP